jgi:cell wall-associated NlpC family hydrolase
MFTPHWSPRTATRRVRPDVPELTEPPNGQTQVTGGFDCSGLTKAAHTAAGLEIPRTAQTQFDAGPRVPPGQAVAPGDPVFFGSSPSSVTHVGIAITSSEMVNAPHRGDGADRADLAVELPECDAAGWQAERRRAIGEALVGRSSRSLTSSYSVP